MLTPNRARGKRTRRGGGGQCTGPSQLGPQVVGVKDAGGKGNSPVPQPVGTGEEVVCPDYATRPLLCGAAGSPITSSRASAPSALPILPVCPGR